MDSQEFIKKIAGLVAKYPSPVFASVRIAQAILESDYGRSTLATQANNLFGIKASAPWVGEHYTVVTREELSGKLIAVNAEFRKYVSWELSVKDHASFFTSTKYRQNVAYASVLSAKTPEDQARALSKSYATDSSYGDKLIRLINQYNLKQYDKGGVQMAKKYPRPRIIDRRTQALGYPNHGVYPKRRLSQIKYFVWHYTATKRTGYGAEIIRGHENYWKNSNGWNLGGYHYYIDRAGNIFWNYDLEIVTYGAGNVNPHCVHVSLEADSKESYTQAQIKAREELTLWALSDPLKHLSGNAVKGHKEFMQTACPGYSIAELNKFRKEISQKLDNDWGTPTPQPIRPTINGIYTVKHGDTLWAIAKAHSVTVDELRDWNGIQQGEWLKTGQVIKTRKTDDTLYTVVKGDTLWAIGQVHGVTVAELVEWNHLKSNVLQVGQMLMTNKPKVEDDPQESPEETKPKEEKITDKLDDPREEAIELKANQELRVSRDGRIKIVTVG